MVALAQTAPLDLDTPGFYTTRREAVEACLARVAAGGAPAMLLAAWERHRGALCRGVSWDRCAALCRSRRGP